MLAGVELTSGVLRNGIMQWYKIFAHDVPQPGAESILENWLQTIATASREYTATAVRRSVYEELGGYFGVSYGARLASVALAIEHRFKTAVVWSGGFPISRQPHAASPRSPS